MAKCSGDNLTGQVATRLQTPHVVLVSDANGNPVTGVTVTWAAASGGGSVDPTTSTTDANGHAQTFRTLGIVIGTQTTTATATIGGTATTVTFSISATAAGASQMTAAGGDGQTGTVGTTLPTPLSVRVADQFNNPVAGVPVTWTPASGSGSVNPPTSTSNASGIASTAWTLGTQAGTQTIQATGAGSPVNFSAIATAGAAAQLTITTEPAATATSGAPFSQQPVLQVRDGAGNPAGGAGVPVTAVIASGPAGATLTNATATTVGSGAATFSGLAISGTAASYTLRFESGTLTTATSGTITLGAGAAATLVKSSGDNLTGQVATRLQTPHVVLISDANSNPVAGVTVTWAAASGGGSVDPTTSTTDANGHAQTFRTLGIVIGTQTTTATATSGRTTTNATFSAAATAAAATTLTITTQRSASGASGAALAQQPVIQVRDAAGNPAGGAGLTVTAVIATGPAGATLTNGTATTVASGAATF